MRNIILSIVLTLVASSVLSQDNVGDGSTNGDLNTNMGDSNTVDSNNSTASSTTNYNGAGSSPGSQPVPSAIAPTMMGGGGNDSCLIPESQGVQISIIGVSKGGMQQDPECNRRKDARLLGAPQQVGGLGLQVSGISIMCNNPRVFRAMALANTPCPLADIVSGKLLIGKEAYLRMRSNPTVYIVGYLDDKNFWDNLLYIGRKLPDAPKETTSTRSLSDAFRRSSGANNGRPQSSGRDNRASTQSSQ